jgi:cobalt-precorrin-5B (C1)-methyltransferase
VDLHWLSQAATNLGGDPELALRITQSNTAMEAFGHARTAGIDLPAGVAASARNTAAQALGEGMRLQVVIFDRSGGLLAQTEPH